MTRAKRRTPFAEWEPPEVALVLLPQGAMVAHVGDSRVYRYRGDRFEQLTFDHSLVWGGWPLRAGRDRCRKTCRGISLPRSLGPHEEVKIDREGPFPVEEGDTFLLCSDGLTNAVADTEIGAIVGALTPEEAARALVDLANLRGGPDNITVIVVRVTGPQIAVEYEDGSYTQGAEVGVSGAGIDCPLGPGPWWWAGGDVRAFVTRCRPGRDEGSYVVGADDGLVFGGPRFLVMGPVP